MYVGVCGAESGLGGHDQASVVALEAKCLKPSSFTIICAIVKFSLPVSLYLLFLTKRPLYLVFNKASTIFLSGIFQAFI